MKKRWLLGWPAPPAIIKPPLGSKPSFAVRAWGLPSTQARTISPIRSGIFAVSAYNRSVNRFFAITNLWDNIREADLRPLRDQALRGVRIAIVGAPGSGRAELADQMRRDPNRPQLTSDAPVLILDLELASQASQADLIILMIDSCNPDTHREQEWVRQWQNSAKRLLVFINQGDSAPGTQAISPWTSRERRGVVIGSPSDTRFLMEKFAPAVIDVIPELLLGLGRYFPLFRLNISRNLINETSLSNAAYSMSTGLAEIVAVLDVPITIADSIILTKAQAFLVYKVGLALGYSTHWKDYIAEFGGVLGSGFVWRQIARSLVGLIPVWGILPKTAISYAGTYVVGNVVLQWYLTGKHLSKGQMQQIYTQALASGKILAKNLAAKLPRPRFRLRLPQFKLALPWRKSPALPAPPKRLAARKKQICSKCSRTSASDASFCQYCGTSFGEE